MTKWHPTLPRIFFAALMYVHTPPSHTHTHTLSLSHTCTNYSYCYLKTDTHNYAQVIPIHTLLLAKLGSKSSHAILREALKWELGNKK